MNNKLYHTLEDVATSLCERRYLDANSILNDVAPRFEKSEIYPKIRDILYDLAFLHKDFVESDEKVDALLEFKTKKAIANIRDFNSTLIN